MTQQVALRLSDALTASVDELVAGGRYATRAAVIRAALSALIEAERRRAIDQAITDGYRRLPESDDEIAVAEAAARRLMADPDLPW